MQSGLKKTPQFWANFQGNSKFLDFAKFYCSQDHGGQNSQIWIKISTRLQISWFTHILSQDLGGQESHNWAKFSTRLKSDFEQNFQGNSKFFEFNHSGHENDGIWEPEKLEYLQIE